MLKKRIVPCLDIKDGRTVKGINFVGLRDAGDPVELAKKYSEAGADELVFLDITATNENRSTLLEMVERVAREVRIPFTVGGGIRSAEDVQAILRCGADKIAVNSAAVLRPALIQEIANQFGNQCVVLAMDVKKVGEQWLVHTHGGSKATALDAFDWAMEAVELGAGELLVTSMDKDGTKSGFDLDFLNQLAQKVHVPIIASGGAGGIQDFVNLFQQTTITAGLAASIFHYGEVGIDDLKQVLKSEKISVR